MEKNKQVGRIEWLDVLKCVAMYLVVISHLIPSWEKDNFGFYLKSFVMSVFFMMSGMTFYIQCTRKEFTFKTLAKNKAKGLLWPYITLQFITYFIWVLNFKILSHNDKTISELILGVIWSNEGFATAPSNALWFLPTLFLIFMVFYVVKKIGQDNYVYIGILSGIIACADYIFVQYIYEFSSPWHIIDVPIGVFCLAVGWVFMGNYEFCMKFIDKTWKKLIWLVTMFPIGVVTAYLNDRISIASNEYGDFILFLASSFSFGIVCIVVCTWLPPLRLMKFVGRNTVVILAFHSPMFRFLENFNEQTAWFISTYPLITSTLVFFACLPVCWVFEKFFPFLIGRGKKKPALTKPSGGGK